MSAQGIPLASYEYLDSTVDAIENLKKAGFKDIKAYAPRTPSTTSSARSGYGQSPVRVFTLVGGLTGTAAGLRLHQLDLGRLAAGRWRQADRCPSRLSWSIAFELTVLFGALSTVIGLFILSRMPEPEAGGRLRPRVHGRTLRRLRRGGGLASTRHARSSKSRGADPSSGRASGRASMRE